MRKIEVVRVGIWSPDLQPDDQCAAVLPLWSPHIQIRIGEQDLSVEDSNAVVASSRGEGITVLGEPEGGENAVAAIPGLRAEMCVHDVCGLALRHLVATHPVVLRGDPVVVLDWAPERLFVLGLKNGRAVFCSCRATPRSPANLARELVRWCGEPPLVLLCGAGLQDPSPVLSGLSAGHIEAELLNPGELAGMTLEIEEPWRYSLSIAMALGWVLAGERDPFIVLRKGSGQGRTSLLRGWAIPVGLVILGAAGFVVGDRARNTELLPGKDVPSIHKIHHMAAKGERSSRRGESINWPQLLWQLPSRKPDGVRLLSVQAKRAPGALIVDVTARSNNEDGASSYVDSFLHAGLFQNGIVKKIRAHRKRGSDITEYDCDIHLEAMGQHE